jgi:hypothetical protein
MFGLLAGIASSVLPSLVGGLFGQQQQSQPQPQHHGHHHHCYGHHDFRAAAEDFAKAQDDFRAAELVGGFNKSLGIMTTFDVIARQQHLADGYSHLADGYSHLREYI